MCVCVCAYARVCDVCVCVCVYVFARARARACVGMHVLAATGKPRDQVGVPGTEGGGRCLAGQYSGWRTHQVLPSLSDPSAPKRSQ